MHLIDSYYKQMNLIAKITLLICSGLLLVSLPIAFWWMLAAQTWIGKAIGIIGLLLVAFPLLIALHAQQRIGKRILKGVTALFLLLLIGVFIAVLLRTPTGVPVADSPVQHRFWGESTFKRYTVANMIPEIEQINLGFMLMPYFDPILTPKQAGDAASFTIPLYQEMEQDENFHTLGSAMGQAYNDFLGLPFQRDHYYLYIPEYQPTKPLPAIVFLHGSAGNFKTYTWVWSKLAEAQGVVIIAPSYGFGNWDEDGVAAVLSAIEDAQQTVAIDPNQIYLAGLSNGGLGVSRLATEHPDLFAGLIFISPVMATDIVDGAAFHSQWAQRPVLVISGDADRRIPIAYVERRVANLRDGGVDVTTVIYPNIDHFLFFAEPDRILDDISIWLAPVRE